MNTVTRMVLLSEDQYRRSFNKPSAAKRLLNKNLPIETKVNYLNTAIAKTNDNFPNLRSDNNQNKVQAILHAIAQSLENEKVEDTNINRTVDNTKQETEEVVESMQENDTQNMNYEHQQLHSLGDEIPRPIFTSTPGPTQPLNFTDESSNQSLKQALRGIPNLLDRSSRIIREDGTIIRGSKLKTIVNYLVTKSPKEKKPNGYNFILDKIIYEYPLLFKHIKNRNAITAFHERSKSSGSSRKKNSSEWSSL